MNFTEILNSLNDASLFDLYRLYVAIGNELENSQRNLKVKQALRIGMATSFFCVSENRLITIVVLELGPKRVKGIDALNKTRYRIPYYMLNIEGADTSIVSKDQQLTMNHLKVGDCVGFNHNGCEIMGTIERLNQKTASLVTQDGHHWRVGYNHLFQVISSELELDASISRYH